MKILQKVHLGIVPHSQVKGITLATIRLVLCSSLLLLFSCSRDYEPEKIMVQEGYTGWIFIVYNQENGQKEKKDGFRIYKIPENGLHFTSFDTNWGIIRSNEKDIQCYYTDKEYKIKSRLPVYIHPDEQFMARYQDSIVSFPCPPHGKGKYRVYPIFIDYLKNLDSKDIGVIPIEEHIIDSILRNE